MPLLKEEKIQREIIDDLENRNVKLVVFRILEPYRLATSPVSSAEAYGKTRVAPLLDQYIEAQFEYADRVGSFEIYRRKNNGLRPSRMFL